MKEFYHNLGGDFFRKSAPSDHLLKTSQIWTEPATICGQDFRLLGGRDLFYDELFRKLLIIQVERESEGLGQTKFR